MCLIVYWLKTNICRKKTAKSRKNYEANGIFADATFPLAFNAWIL